MDEFAKLERSVKPGTREPKVSTRKPKSNTRKSKASTKESQGPVTKTKKRTRESIDLLSPDQHWAIAQLYAKAELPVSAIAEQFATTEENVNLIVTRCWKTLTNIKETRALLGAIPGKDPSSTGFGSSSSRASLAMLHNSKLINQSFLDLLSHTGEERSLTDAESIYTWIYVHTGENDIAIQEAGLDVGLHREKSDDTAKFNYDKAVAFRGLYLRSRPNIASYIKELRERRFVDQDISKSRIQSELLDQLQQMKDSGDSKNRTAMLKTIELLGKTIGAFVERVELSEVNPSKALDELIDMAKRGAVKELTSPKPAQKPIETWEAVE